MSIVLIASLALAAASPAPLIDLYTTLCAPAADAAIPLDRARQRGWTPVQTAGVLRGVRDPGGEWTLKAGDQHVAAERISSCGVETKRAEPDLAAAMEQRLGFAPAFRLAASTTFYAVLQDGAFVDGARLDHAAFAAAKAQGRFYSIMAVSTSGGASLFRLNVLPDRP